MQFHLPFSIPAFSKKINYSDKMLFMGSCFAENIGDTLNRYKFDVSINPHGVLYNPSSIAVALRSYIENKKLLESDLFYANEIWNSKDHHSRFSNADQQACLAEINVAISGAHQRIKNAEWLFITFGSSFVYKRNSQLVGNCHKLPQKEFIKSMLTSAEIIEDYIKLVPELKKINENLKIIFTVSPVRYVRDGVIENNLSKARLVEAVHHLVEEYSNVFYFPAYELIMDDLRDYRFYKSDLLHPNEQAIEYVFEKLMTVSFSEETKLLFGKLKDIITAKHHRPFNSETEAFLKFKNTYLIRSNELQKEFPFLNLKEELDYFG
jgi:hypothetical protein